LSEDKAGAGYLPPQGSVRWYDDFLKLLETRKVAKVDKEFLLNQEIVSGGNAYTIIAGLKFLGLIDKEGNAKEAMETLSIVGEKRKENLRTVLHTAYSLLFDGVKIDLEHTDPDTLVNCFKSDYKMGSLRTAGSAARIFVFLAQKAGIPLSKEIIEELTVSEEKKRETAKPKTEKIKTKQEPKGGQSDKLSEDVLARFSLKDVGYVDIKDRDTFELAKAYLKLVSKKLGIQEDGS
jgi:hypothetical protein